MGENHLGRHLLFLIPHNSKCLFETTETLRAGSEGLRQRSVGTGMAKGSQLGPPEPSDSPPNE